ncbi:hypothetical protein AUL38_04090 [Leucobacter sp. G161]|nr:hypothetical protein AUL38_04090 [Leucobacter sp. G161]
MAIFAIDHFAGVGWGVACRRLGIIEHGVEIAKLARYTESNDWVLRDNQRPPGETEYHSRSIEAPAQTITSQAHLFRFGERPVALQPQYGVGGNPEERGERLADEPASTITSKAGSMKWVARDNSSNSGNGLRSLDVPSRTITSKADRIHVDRHEESHRLTHLEAATLQSFPSDMRWPGSQGERFLAIGNAVPPLLAEAVLGALLAPPAERNEWDLAFAEIAG